ncbi:MAG TPA: phage holin family protein [Candidatus Binatia bacterium]|nr:phage holin family protein [Candidatus Binatia bacterium]
MAREAAQKVPKAGLISLVRGIIDDAKELVHAQYEYRKYQILQQAVKAKTTAIWLAVGAALGGAGGLLIILMVVHLLDALTDIPLWGCYGIVGTVLVAIGAIFLYAGKNRT